MGQSAIIGAIEAQDPELIRAALVAELIPVIASTVDPSTWDPRELGASGGNIWPALGWQEKIWWLDPDDSTTDADEITCIVTVGGYRYKTNDVRVPASVLSYSVTDPPDDNSPPPSYGDAYLVPAGSSGAWAAKEDDIAVWTARGWAYVAPARGYLVYVEDEEGYYHFTASDAWESGTGAYGLPDNSVAPRHLLIRAWHAENQTTTAPPATGPAGETYVIGASATGAWSGNDLKIAYRPSTDAAFVILSPFVGEEIWDKNQGIKFRWNGTSWTSASGSIIGILESTAGAATLNMTGTGGYSMSSTAPTTTTAARVPETLTRTISADYVGQAIEVEYSAQFSTFMDQTKFSAVEYMVVGVFVDSETNAREWIMVGMLPNFAADHCYPVTSKYSFLITLSDTSSHTVKIIFFHRNISSVASMALFDRRLTLRKRA